jgi:hypothetical protein
MVDKTDIDPHSRTWRAVKDWAEARLTSSRSTIEAVGMPPLETEYERGRIAAMRELLALTEPSEVTTAGSTVIE